MNMDQPFLSFQICKRYPGFTLECEARFSSGITAIFGPSGSGKTTLLNCLAGLVTPDQGAIEVLGDGLYSSAGRRNVPPERRRFGYVFQGASLFPHLSVRDNILYGYKLTARDRRKTEPDRLVDLFELSALMDRGVENLSGGERQRVALARALATSPRLLLLDEPLASLDMRFRGIIIRYLRLIWRELGTPMVYVSHSMSEVMALAHDMLVLFDGRPVAQGPPDQMLVHPEAGALADYATFRNVVEAEVVSAADGGGLATLSLGGTHLFAPDVLARPGEAVTISIRAGDIILALEVPSKISARNVLRGAVREVHNREGRVLVYTDVGTTLVVEITARAQRELEVRPGQDVYLIIKSNSVMVIDGPEGRDAGGPA